MYRKVSRIDKRAVYLSGGSPDAVPTMSAQVVAVLDYIDGYEARDIYPWPKDGECPKCGNKVLENGRNQIRCWKCGTYWFKEIYECKNER